MHAAHTNMSVLMVSVSTWHGDVMEISTVKISPMKMWLFAVSSHQLLFLVYLFLLCCWWLWLHSKMSTVHAV